MEEIFLDKFKAFWHSSFHVCGSFFRRSLTMGSQVEVRGELGNESTNVL